MKITTILQYNINDLDVMKIISIFHLTLCGRRSLIVAKSSASNVQLSNEVLNESFSDILEDQMKSMLLYHNTADPAEILWPD